MMLISSTARFQANKIVFHGVILQELLDFMGEEVFEKLVIVIELYIDIQLVMKVVRPP